MRKKEKWHIHCDDDDKSRDYSISLDPGRCGWITDSGARGYGFPKEVAQWICDQLNNSQAICPFVGDYSGWEKL